MLLLAFSKLNYSRNIHAENHTSLPSYAWALHQICKMLQDDSWLETSNQWEKTNRTEKEKSDIKDNIY